MTQLSRNNISL